MTDRLIAWFLACKIECPAEDELDRLTASGRRRFEEHVLDATADRFQRSKERGWTSLCPTPTR